MQDFKFHRSLFRHMALDDRIQEKLPEVNAEFYSWKHGSNISLQPPDAAPLSLRLTLSIKY